MTRPKRTCPRCGCRRAWHAYFTDLETEVCRYCRLESVPAIDPLTPARRSFAKEYGLCGDCGAEPIRTDTATLCAQCAKVRKAVQSLASRRAVRLMRR